MSGVGTIPGCPQYPGMYTGPFQILVMGVLAYKSPLYHSGSYCSRIAGLLGTSWDRLWHYRTSLQNGNNVAVKYYSKKLEKAIKESSVRTWISKYKLVYQKKRRAGETSQPLILGEQLDRRCRAT